MFDWLAALLGAKPRKKRKKMSKGNKKHGKKHCVFPGKSKTPLSCYPTKAQALAAAKRRRKRKGKNGKHLKARVHSRAKKS